LYFSAFPDQTFSEGSFTPSTQSSIQVEDRANWMRLSVANSIHGVEAIRELLSSLSKYFKDKKKLHLWLSNHRMRSRVHFPRFVWEILLGACKNGCPLDCNGETDLDQLPIVALNNIFKYLEHIIPSTVMSQNDILVFKEFKQFFVNTITENRNYLAHYPLKIGMPDSDFDKRWMSIRKALIGMDYSKLPQFDNLRTCSLDKFH